MNDITAKIRPDLMGIQLAMDMLGQVDQMLGILGVDDAQAVQSLVSMTLVSAIITLTEKGTTDIQDRILIREKLCTMIMNGKLSAPNPS